MTDQEVRTIIEQASQVGVYHATTFCVANDVMPFKIRVSIWVKKEDGSYYQTEMDAPVDQAYWQNQHDVWIKNMEEKEKREILNDVQQFIDAGAKEGDETDPSQATSDSDPE